MNKKLKEFFEAEVERATTFLMVKRSKRGRLVVNQQSKDLFLETPITKRIIPLGSNYYQLAGAPYLDDLPSTRITNKRAKENFDADVEKVTTFLLVNRSERGNLLVNQHSHDLFLEASDTKQVIQLGSQYYQLPGAPSIKELPVYPLD